MTKCKKEEYKYDKMQKDKLQMWQNTKQHITNMTKYKMSEYKSDKIQKDHKQMRQNTKQ